MMHRAWWAVGLLAAVTGGCPGPDPSPGPGPSTLQTCAQMGWRCGVDDYGASCGSCGAGTACNGAGTCESTVCTCSFGMPCGACGGRCIGPCAAGTTCELSAGVRVCMGPAAPTVHEVAAGRTPLFSSTHGVPFTVPTAATASGFAASSPSDNFGVGIFTPAEWTNYQAGGMARALAFRDNVRTANEVGPALPAGSYILGLVCRNVIERCVVTYTASAYY